MTDSVLRAITDDGSFRVIAAETTTMVQGALASQSAQGITARHFCDLLTGSVLVRETMSPQHRVQGILKGAAKSGSLVADSHPDGTTRGLVSLRGGATELDLGAGSLLQMMRTMPNGALHQGIVEVPETGGLSAALMGYMQQSEQVAAVLSVATVFEGDRVAAAGGYLVQLLPEAKRAVLATMTARLDTFEDLDSLLTTGRATPQALIKSLLDGMAFSLLEERPVVFQCQCSLERVLASLATIQRSELAEMLAERRVFEINCDYCGKSYPVGPRELEGLLLPN